VPQGDRWIHEIKFDGYRVQLHIANEKVTVFTRNGIDWTRRFKKVAEDGLVAFDLLYLNGYDLRKLPLVER
jgi:bifunctional non-homologous end joining protein LigD